MSHKPTPLNGGSSLDSLTQAQEGTCRMDYRTIDPKRMILRDHLARDRTALANERTLLAYARTAIALLAAGGTLLKFFWESLLTRALGVLLLALGAATMAIGVWRFRVMLHRLRQLSESEDEFDDVERAVPPEDLPT
jgi:putative membrane protein